MDTNRQLTMRVAGADEHLRVVRLAALDSARPPRAPVLVAEEDGELRVAVSLVDLRSVADPFHLTEELRSLAIARATQIRAAGGEVTQPRAIARRGTRRVGLGASA